jgi:hypothetical protein
MKPSARCLVCRTWDAFLSENKSQHSFLQSRDRQFIYWVCLLLDMIIAVAKVLTIVQVSPRAGLLPRRQKSRRTQPRSGTGERRSTVARLGDRGASQGILGCVVYLQRLDQRLRVSSAELSGVYWKAATMKSRSNINLISSSSSNFSFCLF